MSGSAHTISRAGALAAGAVALGGAARFAMGAAPTKRDVEVLQFALVLERFEDAFYRAALASGKLKGELLKYAQTVAKHEKAHTAFLEGALGSAAGPKPKVNVSASIKTPAAFTQSAIKLEDAAVGAYNGQAANVSPGVLAQAATIVSVEARHAAWVRDIAGEPPAADAVDAPMTAEQVQAVLKDLGLRG